MDHVSTKKRSEIMGLVRPRGSGPEKIVRSAIHRLGLRFRLHRRDLPGTPDIVLPRHRTVVFVHGCFWHRHSGCKKATMPKSNTEFWHTKFERNVQRDKENRRALKKLGWNVVTVWQCEVPSIEKATDMLKVRLVGILKAV